MKYATAEDFLIRVGEDEAIALTDRTQEGVVNEDVLDVALQDSSSQIDGYLIGRYPLPLPEKSANLTRLCCDLARYRLASMSDTTITDEIISRYKLSLKELENLAKGVIALDVRFEQSEQGDAELGVQFFNGGKLVFARD